MSRNPISGWILCTIGIFLFVLSAIFTPAFLSFNSGIVTFFAVPGAALSGILLFFIGLYRLVRKGVKWVRTRKNSSFEQST